MSTPFEEKFAGWQQEHYDKTLARIVSDLHRLAEEVEREGVPRYQSTLLNTAVDAATAVVHAVQWGVANLALQTLLHNAQGLDAARSAASAASAAERLPETSLNVEGDT